MLSPIARAQSERGTRTSLTKCRWYTKTAKNQVTNSNSLPTSSVYRFNFCRCFFVENTNRDKSCNRDKNFDYSVVAFERSRVSLVISKLLVSKAGFPSKLTKKIDEMGTLCKNFS